MNQPRAIIYVRQSVARDESISPELQETACREYAARKGYTVTGVESDLGISGRTWKRPAVVRVMEAIEAKEADVILLWKWSRLSRSRRDWAVAIDRCEVAGGRIESSTEDVDVSTSTGRLARGMLVEFAAFESERIGDTWRESHARRIAQGKPHNGRERFGYMKDGSGSFVAHPVEAPVVRDLYARYIAGDSFYSLAQWLNAEGYRSRRGYAYTAASVLQMLDRVFYVGRVSWHGGDLEGEHEGLIGVDVWQQYQAARGLRRVAPETMAKRKIHLLGGFLRCGCGERMFGRERASTGTRRYECGAKRCDAEPRSVDMWEADETIVEYLRDLAGTVDDAAGVSQTPDPDLAAALQRAGEAHAALARLTVEYARGVIPEGAYVAATNQLEADAKAAEASATRIGRRAARAGRVSPDLLADWERMDVGAKRALLGEIVDRITWTGVRGLPKRFTIHVK